MALRSDLPVNGLEPTYYGAIFELYLGSPHYSIEVSRAPDDGTGGSSYGNPSTGSAVSLQVLRPGTRRYYQKSYASGSWWWYRFRHIRGGETPSGWTAWIPVKWVEYPRREPTAPPAPRFDFDLALDDSDGTVDLDSNSEPVVQSIEYATSTSGWPSFPGTTEDCDENGDAAVADILTLSAGETGYVSVRFYTATGGGGSLLGGLRQSVTRGTAGTGKIVPLVEEQLSPSAHTLTLVINDPDVYVDAVHYRIWNPSTGAWSPDWTLDAAPYGPWTALLSERHNGIIEYRISYDLGDGAGTEYIRRSVTFDLDAIPSLTTPGVSIDDSGAATLSFAGDDDVASIRYAYATGASPSYPDLTTTRAGTVVAGRVGDSISLGTVPEGETIKVSVLGYVSPTGSGTESAELYRAEASRPTDTDTVLDRVPTVQATAGVAGVTLVLNDPDSVVDLVGFRTYDPATETWSGWTDDTSPPFTLVKNITRAEKHNGAVGWRVRYDVGDGNVYLENSIAFDSDRIPELSNVNLSVDDSGNVYLAYTGDDDVASVKWYDGTSYPSKATVESSGTVSDANSASNVLVQSGVAEGATRYVGVVAYTGAAGTGTVSSRLWLARVTRPTDTNTQAARAPQVRATAGLADVTLTLHDPDDVVTGVGFRTYTGGAWSGWTDDTSDPYTLVKAVTREEKHNVAIGWRVRYDLGGGNEYVENSITYDPDSNPELDSIDLSVDDSGEVFLAFTGDDDTLSIKYIDSTSFPTKGTVESSGTVVNGSSGSNVSVHTGLAEGATRYIGVVPYSGATGSGSPGTKMLVARVTRPTDTTGGTDVTINAKRTVDLDGDVNMRWFGTAGVGSISYLSNKTGFGSWATDTGDAQWSSPDGTQNVGGTMRGNMLLALETLAYGETAYIALLGWTGSAGTGTKSTSIFTTEIQRIPVFKGDAPEQVVYAVSTPGESGFVTGDLWYETDQTPWIKRVFDSTKGAGLKWTKAATTFPLGKALNSVGATKSQVLTPWPLITFQDNILLDGTEQGISWAVSEGSSDFRVSCAVWTLIESASDLNITGRSSGEYLKWDGSEYVFDTPSGSDPALLSDVGDVSTGYANGDLLYYGTSWGGATPVELDLVTDTSISVQEADSHKGYLGNDNDINFEAGSGATIDVTDEGSKITVTYGLDTSAIISTGGENDGNYQIGIDANGGGTNYFRVRTGTYTGGGIRLELNELGDLSIYGDLTIGTESSGQTCLLHVNDAGYFSMDAASSGRDIQLEATGTPTSGDNNFNLYDGTNRSNITPLHGFDTGTGAPTGTPVTGAIYMRHEA